MRHTHGTFGKMDEKESISPQVGCSQINGQIMQIFSGPLQETPSLTFGAGISGVISSFIHTSSSSSGCSKTLNLYTKVLHTPNTKSTYFLDLILTNRYVYSLPRDPVEVIEYPSALGFLALLHNLHLPLGFVQKEEAGLRISSLLFSRCLPPSSSLSIG